MFVICLFNSQTIGNSFSVQGTPSSIVRLKISKSIKDVRHNNITSSHQNQNKQIRIYHTEHPFDILNFSKDIECHPLLL